MLAAISCTPVPPPPAAPPSPHVDAPAVVATPKDAEPRVLDVQHPGCFVVLDLAGGPTARHDATPGECDRATIPASTFKIPHALIALQTGVVRDPEETVPWDGTDQWLDAAERDHSLRSAIVESVLWFFRRTATEIGPSRMQQWLTTLDFGNAKVAGKIDLFWLAGGSLEVSPLEQVDFYERMFHGELAVDPAHVATVTDIMRSDLLRWKARVGPEFAFPSSTATVWAKTGTDEVDGVRLTWWVGVVQGPKGKHAFASRVLDRGELGARSPAVEHGIAALVELGML